MITNMLAAIVYLLSMIGIIKRDFDSERADLMTVALAGLNFFAFVLVIIGILIDLGTIDHSPIVNDEQLYHNAISNNFIKVMYLNEKNTKNNIIYIYKRFESR